MTTGHNQSRDRSAIVENSSCKRLPQELQDQICLSTFSPRTIIIQDMLRNIDKGYYPQHIEEVGAPYDQPVMLAVSPNSRDQTLQYYTRILTYRIPANKVLEGDRYKETIELDPVSSDFYVYFNYKLDTLMYHPQEFKPKPPNKRSHSRKIRGVRYYCCL